MSRFQFELATAKDDQEICQLLRMTPMDGPMQIAFCRQPSYFQASVVEGSRHQTIICRDQQRHGRIVGIGSRSVQRRWVHGQSMEIGYLSGLRILPEARSLGLLARGFRVMRQLHEADPLPLYLTTIATGNDTAWELLTSGRAGLPQYHFVTDYHSIAIPLSRSHSTFSLPYRDGKFELRTPDEKDFETMIAFWNRIGSQKQFFPDYDIEELESSCGRLTGLYADNWLIAWHNERIVGTLGSWDQTAFRRTVVHGYSRWLTLARPLANAWSKIKGKAGLPRKGEPLRLLLGAALVIEDNDPDCFAALLNASLRMNSGRGFSHFILGLSASDPLLEALRHHSTRYRTRLCYVDWDASSCPREQLDNRTPYLEVGGL